MSSRVSRKAKFMSIFFSDKSRELRNIIAETVIIAVAISGLSLAEMAIVSVQRLLLLRSLARQKEEKTFGTSTPPSLPWIITVSPTMFLKPLDLSQEAPV
ncbi:hypothetical protein [Pseudomonas helleri]|jgi:hypothetical protein|uniref:hypothetical protein n=2 Tax=Pseudomonas helleri TaxID=1608996 RepID=UPI002F35105D